MPIKTNHVPIKININVVGYVLKNLDPTITIKRLMADSQGYISEMTWKRSTNLGEQYRFKKMPHTIDREILETLFGLYKKEFFRDQDADILRKIRSLLEYINADIAPLEEYFYCDFDTFFSKFYLEAVCFYTGKSEKTIAEGSAKEEIDPDSPVLYQTVSDLRSRGFSLSKIAGNLLQHLQAFGQEIPDNRYLSEQIQHFPNRWGFLLASERIIGAFAISFLSADDEKLIRAGRLPKHRDLASAPSNADVAIELRYLSVAPEFATDENYNTLWREFGEKLLELAINGTYFRAIYTTLIKTNQTPFFVNKGFQQLCSRKNGHGETFRIDLTYGVPHSFSDILPGLYDRYADTFGEITFGGCPSAEELTIQQAQDLGGLLYATDRYISSAMFNDPAEAKVLFGNLLKMDTDNVYRTEYIFCAYRGEKIIGIVHYAVGPVIWSAAALQEEAFFVGIPLKETVKSVEEEYFISYNQQDPKTMTLLNVCVDPLWRSSNFRLGTRMMEAFLDRFGADFDMDLHVLQETENAVRLYRAAGFKSDGKTYDGFSLDTNKPTCFYMKRPKSKS